jgi:hypothetical protein
MTRRRLQLAAPRSGEIAGGIARSMGPRSLMLGAGALLACGYLVGRPRASQGRAARRGTGVAAR